jgi:hypothetical protein
MFRSHKGYSQHRLSTIQAEEYVISRRIAILLHQWIEATAFQIPVLLKASFR